MRKVAEYFGRMATYGTEIQSTIMKIYPRVIARPVKVHTVNLDIGKIYDEKTTIGMVIADEQAVGEYGSVVQRDTRAEYEQHQIEA